MLPEDVSTMLTSRRDFVTRKGIHCLLLLYPKAITIYRQAHKSGQMNKEPRPHAQNDLVLSANCKDNEIIYTIAMSHPTSPKTNNAVYLKKQNSSTPFVT